MNDQDKVLTTAINLAYAAGYVREIEPYVDHDQGSWGHNRRGRSFTGADMYRQAGRGHFCGMAACFLGWAATSPRLMVHDSEKIDTYGMGFSQFMIGGYCDRVYPTVLSRDEHDIIFEQSSVSGCPNVAGRLFSSDLGFTLPEACDVADQLSKELFEFYRNM